MKWTAPSRSTCAASSTCSATTSTRSPRVYVRELLQNAVDAITARRAADPAAPALIRIEPPEQTGDGTLRVHDTGIGLTEAQVHELLATIGRSSKRDELGFARHEFLGQFGIGLLSCFLVADEIRVLTRHGDGADGALDRLLRRPLRGADRRRARDPASRAPRSRWCRAAAPSSGSTAATVTELARLYGSLLPVDGPGRRRADHRRRAAVAARRRRAAERREPSCGTPRRPSASPRST